MGRGQGWSDVELEQLARAWVFATEDPVTGIDQTAARFKATLFTKFSSFAPADASEKVYGGRTPKSVRAKFDEVSADVQKFRGALRKVTSSFPTGCSDTEVLSMAIAIHMGKRSDMSYEAKMYPHSSWRNHLAYKILRRLPKYSDEGMANNMGNQASQRNVDQDGSDDSDDQTPQQTPPVPTPTHGDSVASTSSTATGSQNTVVGSQRPKGKKAALRLRVEDDIRRKALENAREISASLKRRNELAEEKIALLAYRKEECETPEDLQDRNEYLRLLRKQRLGALRRRICSTERATPTAFGDSQGSSLSNRADIVSAEGDENEVNEVSDLQISEQRDSEV